MASAKIPPTRIKTITSLRKTTSSELEPSAAQAVEPAASVTRTVPRATRDAFVNDFVIAGKMDVGRVREYSRAGFACDAPDCD